MFYGPNTSYTTNYGATGDVGGGYYVITNPEALPTIGAFLGYTSYTWQIDGTSGFDNSLQDSTTHDPFRHIDPSKLPLTQLGSHVNALATTTESGAYIRYGPISDPNNLTLYTDVGPIPSIGTTLGAFVTNQSITAIAGLPGDRYTYIDGPVHKPFVGSDLLTMHSLDVQVDPADPATIVARFAPRLQTPFGTISVDLDTAKSLLQVNHFNWIQRITDPLPPIGWKTEIVHADGTRDLAPNPRHDPIVSSTDHYEVSSQWHPDPVPIVPTTIIDGVEVNITPDRLPYYYNEYGDDPITKYTGTFSVQFSDRPSTYKSLVPGIVPRHFVTELVGVRDNGPDLITGVKFSWTTDAINGVQIFRDYGVGTEPILSGGVYDIRVFDANSVDEVPEPASIVMLALGVSGTLGWKRLRRSVSESR
jgi:hypothetical protein